MNRAFTFHILDSVDSTNNYAMAKLREGLAESGTAWFALQQTAGRGQRGRTWHSNNGENILMSLLVRPDKAFSPKPFVFHMAVALEIRDFIAEKTGVLATIKWPNDIYINDRKAGGILVESIYRGMDWQWAVVGIGINVNQISFPDDGFRAISFNQITGTTFDPIELGKELQQKLIIAWMNAVENQESIFYKYQQHLFKKGEVVCFNTPKGSFSTRINGVDDQGRLITDAGVFLNEEISWVL